MNQLRQDDGGDAPMTSAAFHGGFANPGSSQSQQQQHQQTAAAAATTMTMMEPATTAPAASMTAPPEVLTLTLQPRPSVRWEEETVDNEGLGRKSSKRCCIFHKQRDFGESSTDSSDNDGDDNNDSDDSSSSGGPRQQGAPPRRPIARPKKQPNKDAQRYHA